MIAPGRFCIAGTDTGAGKTFVSALATAEWRRRGTDVVAFKPICCGDRGDAHQLSEACSAPLEIVNPVWLKTPATPAVGAAIEGVRLDIPAIAKHIHAHAREAVLVEGVGGWLAPLTDSLTMADLARAVGYPVLLVVGNRLGCLNHTLLTLRAIAADGLPCDGLVVNDLPGVDPWLADTNAAMLAHHADAPIRWRIRKPADTPGNASSPRCREAVLRR
jgi:dethiobiotin synthetase